MNFYNHLQILELCLIFIFSFENIGYALPDVACRTNLRPPVGINYNRARETERVVQASNLQKLARDAFESLNYDEALKLLEEALKLNPGDKGIIADKENVKLFKRLGLYNLQDSQEVADYSSENLGITKEEGYLYMVIDVGKINDVRNKGLNPNYGDPDYGSITWLYDWKQKGFGRWYGLSSRVIRVKEEELAHLDGRIGRYFEGIYFTGIIPPEYLYFFDAASRKWLPVTSLPAVQPENLAGSLTMPSSLRQDI